MRLNFLSVLFTSSLMVTFSVSGETSSPSKTNEPAANKKSSQEVAKKATLKIPDYGPAFEKLIQLGVPDTKGATYIKIIFSKESKELLEERRTGDDYNRDRLRIRTLGNAWLLGKDKNGLSTVIYDDFKTLHVKKKAHRNGLLRLLAGSEKTSKDGAFHADWKKADVQKDVSKILKSLEKASNEGKHLDPDQWEYTESGPQWGALVLVKACHLYRAGFTQEANEIADILFEKAPNKVVIIDQLVNQLAEQQYNSLTKAFFKSHDWKAYRDGLDGLIKKFTRGWKNRAGVELLLSKINRQLDTHKKPTIKSLPKVSLNPKAVKLLDSWLTASEGVTQDAPMGWLLGTNSVSPYGDQIYSANNQNKNTARTSQLTALGMDGLIALAAVVTDDHLIPVKQKTSEYGMYGYNGVIRMNAISMSDESLQATSIYAKLDRPCSRGEIARSALILTLPIADADLPSVSDEELQQITYQWWLKHRNDSPVELNEEFYNSGKRQYRQLALQALMNIKTPKADKLLEKRFLESSEITQNLEFIRQYLQTRKQKARPFFVKFSKALKEELADADKSSINWVIRQEGGVEKYLKKLSLYVNDVEPTQIISDIKSGKVTIKEGFAQLKTLVTYKEFPSVLPQLIQLIRHQPSQKKMVDGIVALYELSNGLQIPETNSDKQKDYKQSLLATIGEAKDDYLWLLKKTEPLLEQPDGMFEFSNIAELTKRLILALYDGENQKLMFHLTDIVSQKEMKSLVSKRVEILLKGDKLPPFPNESLVKDARRKEISDAIRPLSSIEVAKYYEKLNLSEKLAWPEILKSFGETPPPGVKGLDTIISRVKWVYGSKSDDAILAEIKKLALYHQFDAALLSKIQLHLFDHANTYQTTFFLLVGDKPYGNTLALISGKTKYYNVKNLLTNEEVAESLKNPAQKYAIVGFRSYDADNESISCIIGKQPAPESKTKKKIDAIVKAMTDFRENEKRFYLYFYSETAKSYKKRMEESQADEDDSLE